MSSTHTASGTQAASSTHTASGAQTARLMDGTGPARRIIESAAATAADFHRRTGAARAWRPSSSARILRR